MPTELLTRVNWDPIFPVFTERCFDLAAACVKRGVQYYAISGYRPIAEQADLYALGRTKRNPVGITPNKPMGNIVSNAKPGSSYHNYAIASDWCRDKEMKRAGLQPDWDPESYRILAEEAEKLGLEAGLLWETFVDAPHIQLPLKKHGIKLADLSKLVQKGGLPAAHEYLAKFAW